ncbi:MAG TPA: hypothetical protein V6C76_16035 [Drouetiella sp.]
MNRIVSALVLLFFALSSARAKASESSGDAYSDLMLKRVSIVALLANPDKFNDKVVFVDGILHNVFEDDTLYLNREMADSLIKTNGIGLHYNEKNLKLIPASKSGGTKIDRNYFNNKLCAVRGTFKADSHTLEDISIVWEDSIVVKKH